MGLTLDKIARNVAVRIKVRMTNRSCPIVNLILNPD
jgi:hypothetical protein